MGCEALDQAKWRATGNKDDTLTANFFLETIEMKIQQYWNDLVYSGQSIISKELIDYVLGRTASKAKIVQEF